jgi:AcrR family transcriptional regulator
LLDIKLNGELTLKEKISKKDKIINTTLKLIAEKGNLDFTIREIVLNADVNIASVNYYFGTKKKLIQEIEKKFSKKYAEYENILKDTQITPRERLLKWANSLTEYMVSNPGVISIMCNKIFLSVDFNSNLELSLQKTNKYLVRIIKEITNINDEEIIQFKLVKLNADLFYPLLFIRDFVKLFGFSIQNHESRRKYIKAVIDSI